MKHFYLCLFAIICFSPQLIAQSGKPEHIRIAGNFFAERQMIHNKSSVFVPRITNTTDVKAGDFTVAKAVNFENGGFVLIAESKHTFPVLGYSLKGSFTGENLPEALQAWLRYYGRQIEFAQSQGSTPEQIIQARDAYLSGNIKSSGRTVEPMLQTQWDQGNYYNGACPPNPAGPGGRCYAGCVATAVGQLMFYHRWPNQGTGEYSYVHPVYGVQYANFEETTYLWNGMETSLNSANPYIAQLLYHLGISFDMDYGPNGSGMWNHSAANSMRNFFKYGPQTQYIFRDTTTMNWDSILVANLEARKPLYYAGWEGVGSQNGHAFVCDGYAPDNFYHFNWGWSGSYDGYFLLSALTPGGNNFNFAQEVIKDIYPDTTMYNYPEYCSNNSSLTTISGTFTDGSNMINYPGSSECFWQIAPDEPDFDSISSIQLQFPYADLATGDFIRIYDNSNMTNLLAEVTQNQNPGMITVPGNEAYVWFSGEEGNADGFLASYKSILPVYCSGTTTFNSPSGLFDDGSGDKKYSNNSICKWRIIPEQLVPLSLTFNYFDLEEGKDFLKIYDLSNQQLVASLTGDSLPGNVIIPGGKAYLVFTTDGQGTAPGWEISWAPQGSVENNLIAGKTLLVYPNPADDFLNIVLPDSFTNVSEVSIFDVTGKLLSRKALIKTGNGQAIIETSSLPQGVYLLRINSVNDWRQVRFIRK